MWHSPTGIDLSVAANAFPYNAPVTVGQIENSGFTHT